MKRELENIERIEKKTSIEISEVISERDVMSSSDSRERERGRQPFIVRKDHLFLEKSLRRLMHLFLSLPQQENHEHPLQLFCIHFVGERKVLKATRVNEHKRETSTWNIYRRECV
jgi:hypothetical protein